MLTCDFYLNAFEAGGDVESRLSSRKGSGDALPDDTRADMESRFGADFSDVRVHDDGEAVQLSQELGAKAFTHGRDVYFGAGSYNPDSSSGQRLLAHELTHVVQQTGGQDTSRLDRATEDRTVPHVSPGAIGVQRIEEDRIEDRVNRTENWIGKDPPGSLQIRYSSQDEWTNDKEREEEAVVSYWREKMEARIGQLVKDADAIKSPPNEWEERYQLIWHREMRRRICSEAKTSPLGKEPGDNWLEQYETAWQMTMGKRIKEQAGSSDLGKQAPDDWTIEYKVIWNQKMDFRIAREEEGIGRREKRIKKREELKKQGKSLGGEERTKPELEQELKEARGELEKAQEQVRKGKRRRGARKEKTPWEKWLEQQAAKKKTEEAKKESETIEEEKTGETPPPLEVKLVLAERHYNLQVQKGEETETITVTGDGGCFYHSLARAKMIHENPKKYATMSLEEVKNFLGTGIGPETKEDVEKAEGELRTMFADQLVILKGTNLPLLKGKVKQAFVDIASEVWAKTMKLNGQYDGQAQPTCSGLSGERTALTTLIKDWLAQKEGIGTNALPKEGVRKVWLAEHYPPTSKNENDLVDLYITEVKENRKFYADVEVETLFTTEELRKALGFGYVKMSGD